MRLFFDNRGDVRTSPLLISSLIRFSCMTMTAATVFCVGTANAGFTAFFSTDNIEGTAANDGRNYPDDNEIRHSTFTSLNN